MLFKKKEDIRLEELERINMKLKEVLKSFEDALSKISEIEENIELLQEQLDKLDEHQKGTDVMVQ